jgi:aspartyl-tRNA synthetase
LSRLSAAFLVQRRFLADAAHELRTPVTALRLQLQLLEQAGSEADRRDALTDLKAGIDRSQRLIEQFLEVSSAEADGEAKPMELVDLSDELSDTDFAPFADTLARGGEIKCIVVKGKVDYSRKQLDDLQEFAKRYGAGALAWIKLGQDETTSSLLKVLGEEKIAELASVAGAEKGDAVLIIAGRKSVVAASLGALRLEIARREDLIDRNTYKPLIVTEFPMFEHDEESGRYDAAHHPFTSPMDEDLDLFKRAIENESEHHLLGQVRAKAYDAVINGYECAGGSIRIHQKEIQDLNFKALGMTPEKARERFGFFLDALEFGTPPHGGFAAGIERTCMILCRTENIRDVMAFPKTASAQDLMMDAPGDVDEAQLSELGIRITE